MFGIGKRWLCAAVALLAVTVPNAGVGRADPAPEGKTLVVLGDSYAANPACDAVLVKCVDPEKTGLASCLRGPTSWPVELAARLRLGAEDFTNNSCSGSSIDTGPTTSTGEEVRGRDGYTLAQQTLNAAQSGSFGSRTAVVAIQMGFNDSWPRDATLAPAANMVFTCVFNVVQGCDENAVAEGRWPDPDAVNGAAYADRIRKVVDFVKYYAPNAQVLLVGYPEVLAESDTAWCFDAFGAVRWVQPQARAMVEFWNRLQSAQRDAAALLGIGFVDVLQATAGHGLCSADPWYTNYLDPRSTLSGLPFHPTPPGDAAVATAVHDQITRTR
ncbi:SGNH/GDSL hydrolase family protein [Nocardia sp. NPDC003693]